MFWPDNLGHKLIMLTRIGSKICFYFSISFHPRLLALRYITGVIKNFYLKHACIVILGYERNQLHSWQNTVHPSVITV